MTISKDNNIEKTKTEEVKVKKAKIEKDKNIVIKPISELITTKLK